MLPETKEKVLAFIRDNPGSSAEAIMRRFRGRKGGCSLSELEREKLIVWIGGGWFERVVRCSLCPGLSFKDDPRGISAERARSEHARRVHGPRMVAGSICPAGDHHDVELAATGERICRKCSVAIER